MGADVICVTSAISPSLTAVQDLRLKKTDHDGAWLTERAACELPMGLGQPGQRTGFTGHTLRVVEAWWPHRRDHRSRHPSLCRLQLPL